MAGRDGRLIGLFDCVGICLNINDKIRLLLTFFLYELWINNFHLLYNSDLLEEKIEVRLRTLIAILFCFHAHLFWYKAYIPGFMLNNRTRTGIW